MSRIYLNLVFIPKSENLCIRLLEYLIGFKIFRYIFLHSDCRIYLNPVFIPKSENLCIRLLEYLIGFKIFIYIFLHSDLV